MTTETTETSSNPPETAFTARPQKGPQEKFLSSPADIVIYGGAAGGGKTFGLLLEPLRHITTRQGYGAVIFRRTTIQVRNEGGMWKESSNLYMPFGARAHETRLEWMFPPYGNTVKFAHMELEKDRFGYQGAQIAFIGWDELTHFTEEQFFYMLSRNRTTCGIKPYIRATTNPDADSWVAEFISWWINQESGFPIPERDGVMRWFVRVNDELHWASTAQELKPLCTQGVTPKSVTFIAAKVQDNPALLERDPGYLANLHALSFVEKERLYSGNWKIRPSAGLVFPRAAFRFVDNPPYDAVARVRYWDKAGTEGSGKFTAGVLMSRTADDAYVIEHVVRGQWSSVNREKVILQTARMDGPDVNVWVEQEPGSGGKESAENTIRRLAGYAVMAERVTGDKETRARPLAAQVQGHNVALVRAEWNKPYLDELDAFPEGRFSDQADASSGAFNKLAAMIVVDDMNSEWLPGIPEEELGGRI